MVMTRPDAERVALIVGAGLAGGNAAVTLREGGWSGPIVMLSQEPGIPFGRPPLSKTYLRGEETLDGWLVKPADWYANNRVELRTGVTVVSVDTARKRVVLGGGETLDYGVLLLSTGGRNRQLRVPGSTLLGIHQLRTIAECEAIRADARPGARAVIIGMGFIGSEVAASLRQLGLEVTTVFSGKAPLVAVLGEQVGTVMAGIHQSHGVRLIADDQVAGFEGSDHVTRVITAKGARIDCDLVVAGIGIEPAVDTLAGSQIAQDNGILVDEHCQTSVSDVYAAGDVANHLHPIFGRLRVEHYNNAERQGRAAARAILGDPRPYDDIHSFWSDQYDDKIEYIGFARTWDRLVVRGSLPDRRFLAFYLERGVMKAALGLNRGGDPEIDLDGELAACRSLIRDRAVIPEDKLADERVDLRSVTA
jgi:3-phenylpropionate/trans-cinnamate dioxygenase ferredoxin reductase subunit